MAQTPPNILWIVSDQHRRDWMRHSGAAWLRTPHLDELAARGVSFAEAICPTPLCGPSRMAMLTGRHSEKLGVYINEDALSSDVPTVAHTLARAGYETVLCGRMHFHGPDQRHGYMRRLAGDFNMTYAGGPHAHLGDLEGSSGGGRAAIAKAGAHPANPVLQQDVHVTACAEEFLRQWSERGAIHRPLFLTVGYMAPHNPFNVPAEVLTESMARWKASGDQIHRAEPDSMHPWVRQRQQRSHYDTDLTEERLAVIRACYGGMIEHTDQCIGRVLQAARKLPGDTLVVYVSDHGEMLGDHLWLTKTVFYEASVGVPMIIAPLTAERNPWSIPAGRRMAGAPVSLIDLPSTFAELAAAPVLPNQDGISLWPSVLAGRPEGALSADRAVFSSMKILTSSPARMVRKGRYKLSLYHGYATGELFDLETDSREFNNRWDDPNLADVREQLTRLVQDGWDPVAMEADYKRRERDRDYLMAWGRAAGPGQGEIWTASPPPPGEFPRHFPQ